MQLLFPLEESSLHPSLRRRLRGNAALGGRVEGFSFLKKLTIFMQVRGCVRPGNSSPAV